MSGGGTVIVAVDEPGMPFDAFAHFSEQLNIIVVSVRLAVAVREFLINQLLGLADGGPSFTVRVPVGEADLLYAAPLADGELWRIYVDDN